MDGMDRWMAAGAAAIIIAVALYLLLPEEESGADGMRIGFFPNMLHAQALVGRAQGAFQQALGNGTEVEMISFNAGPSAIEAIFADQIDIAYIGPNPAINGYIKSNGEALVIIAGAASGGAVLVVRNDSDVTKAADFAGKRVASPQLGNTQDVALRAWLMDNNLTVGTEAGQVEVVPTANPDILALFQKKEIDAAWVPEPWGARLVQEGGGRVYLDERTLWPGGGFATASVIVSKKYLKEHPEEVRKFLKAHVNLTRWINAHPQEAKAIMNAQIENVTGRNLPAGVVDEAYSRYEVTYDPVRDSLMESAGDAYRLGFLGGKEPNLSGIYDLALLNEVLEEEGLGG
jgi:NitT/TauT family transport system substrate-binding protein